MEFEIEFTDITLAEADGYFKEVQEIMKQDSVCKVWHLRSHATITSEAGIGAIEIQCNNKKDIYILSYIPSIGDLYYNPDIQALSMWAQESGWNVPQPHSDLVKSNISFWRHFWETLIINSDYMDLKYGIRPQLVINKKKRNRSKK